MDTIHIKDLSVSTTIGAYEWEKHLKQTVILDIRLGVDITQAGKSDALIDAIDYAAVCEFLTADLAKQQFSLLESLIEHVARTIHQQFAVKKIALTACKPHAIKNARHVAISITRDFSQGAS